MLRSCDGVPVSIAADEDVALYAPENLPFIAACSPERVTELIESKRREVARAKHRGGWMFTTFTPMDHVDDCDCEQADGWMVEDTDPRCTEREPRTAVVLDDGAYTLWVIDLDQFREALDRLDTNELHEEGGGVFVTVDGCAALDSSFDPVGAAVAEAVAVERARWQDAAKGTLYQIVTCACGGRHESPKTHPHAPGCPAAILGNLLAAIEEGGDQ